MNITQNNIDDLNAVLTVVIEKDDYQEKVEKVLKDYKKNTTIKGFRKGQVPMSLIRKQHEKAIVFDEVNQLLQKGINDHIQNEKISILGNPLPIADEAFDWDSDQLEFKFELGLAPEFDVDLSKVEVETYKVKVDDEEVQKYVENFAKRFGSMKSLEKVAKEGEVNIKVILKELDEDNKIVEGGLEKETFLFTEEIANAKDFYGKKPGDVIVVNSKDLYEDPMKLENILGVSAEEVAEFDKNLEVTIKEITMMESSEVNQELFDKVYGEGTVKDETEFRQKIREEAEKMYSRETDKQMMNDVVKTLINVTEFDLPKDFLSRWLHETNEKIESLEAAKEQLVKEEEGLRYQLIESKVAEKYEINVEYIDVESTAKKLITEQLAMYGQANMPEEDLDKIVQSSLQNQEEFRRMADQVFADKMMQAFKDNVKLTQKEVTFDEFVKIMEEKQKAVDA